MVPRITVVGSSNTDMVVRLDRLPGRGETIVGGDLAMVAGGKGANQAVAAARLGAEARLIARVGRDMFGDASVRAFEQSGLLTDCVLRDPLAPSGVALILVEHSGENMIAVAPGANMRLTPADIDSVKLALVSADVVVTQLEIPPETVERTLRAAKEAGVRTILNPAPARAVDDVLWQWVDVLTPNEHEAATLVGFAVDDVESARRAAQQLLRRGPEIVVVTLGKRGALLATSDTIHLVEAYSVAAVDTTAAGDAFTAALAFALARGDGPAAAVDFANAVAALSTTKAGAQPSLPTMAEVESFLAEESS